MQNGTGTAEDPIHIDEPIAPEQGQGEDDHMGNVPLITTTRVWHPTMSFVPGFLRRSQRVECVFHEYSINGTETRWRKDTPMSWDTFCEYQRNPMQFHRNYTEDAGKYAFSYTNQFMGAQPGMMGLYHDRKYLINISVNQDLITALNVDFTDFGLHYQQCLNEKTIWPEMRTIKQGTFRFLYGLLFDLDAHVHAGPCKEQFTLWTEDSQGDWPDDDYGMVRDHYNYLYNMVVRYNFEDEMTKVGWIENSLHVFLLCFFQAIRERLSELSNEFFIK